MIKKVLASTVLCVFFLLNMVIWVSADSNVSNFGYYTVNSIDYANQARIDTGVDKSNPIWTMWVRGSATVYADGNVSSGTMGVKARVFNGSNDLITESDIFYNTYTTDGWTAFTSKKTVQMGYYYGKGITYAYNGSTYTAYNTFATPLTYTSD